MTDTGGTVVARLVGALSAALLLVLTGCGGSGTGPSSAASTAEPSATAAGTGNQACPTLPRVPPRSDGLPALTLPCLGEGPDVRLSDLRGTPTVLNVWAAWCTNCDREMPLFASAERAAGERVRFFGVHYKAERAYGLRSVADFGVPFPSVHDEDGDRVVQELRAYGPPQTLFVTADGRVAGRVIGEITSEAELRRLIRAHLGVAL